MDTGTLKLKFSDWELSQPPIQTVGRQYDNLSRTLAVAGELPEGWTWDLLVQAEDEAGVKRLDVIRLEPVEGGVGIALTAEMLAVCGYYEAQLRGTRGDVVRHTNRVNLFVPGSLSGDAQWPELPSAFSQAEARVRAAADRAEAAAGHSPIVGENDTWRVWDPDKGEYADTGVSANGRPGPKGEDGREGAPGPKGEDGAPGPRGDSGVYVGSGEMPEGYNVQIDPDGKASVGLPAFGPEDNGKVFGVADGAAALLPAPVGAADLTYKWAAKGYMREQVRPFQGWAQCVQFDPKLGVAVGIINSGTAPHSNTQPWYRVTIDPKTGYMSDYVEITVVDENEVPFDPGNGYMGSFCILSDGTYLAIDGSQNIYAGMNQGATLKRLRQYSFTSVSDGSMFGLTELSNGRLLTGHGGQVNKLWYSDDKGVSWTGVVPANTNLGQQAYPEGRYTPFEPCFIDCGEGKVICFARASMNAYANYPDSCSACEGAVISRSTDYGTSWSAWEWSKSIPDMTACNMKCTVIDGIAHAVVASRYHGYINDKGATPFFALRYTYAKLADVYADHWAEPVVIEEGHWDPETAVNKHDCGYPSIWNDSSKNLFCVYYDSDGAGTAFGANWRLAIGTPATAQISSVASGKGSCIVGYSQAAVDAIVSGMMSKINDLYLKIGELPENPELDGMYPVTSGLVEWFDAGDSSQFDGYTIKSKVSSGKAGIHLAGNNVEVIYENQIAAPETFLGNMANGGVLFSAPFCDYDISGEFSVEFVWDVNVNQSVFAFLPPNPNMNGTNTSVFRQNNNVAGGYKTNASHMVIVFGEAETKYYHNGVYGGTFDITLEQALNSVLLIRPWGGGCGGIRLYNRALAEVEIRNNDQYAAKLTDFNSSYF